MYYRFPILASLLLLLNGCALVTGKNLAPIPSEREFSSFSTRVSSPAGSPEPTLETYKTALVAFIGEYHGYAAERRRMEWDSSGLSTYGGMGAVLGALADKTGLLNTGVAVAGIGLTTTSRYNFAQQSQVYFTAVKKLSCVNSKVAGIPNTVIPDAKRSADDNAAKIAEGAMPQLINAVEAIRIEATNGVLGISPGMPSRDEMISMFRSYAPAAVGAAAAPVAGVSPADAQRYKEAGEQVKTMLSEVGTCAKS